GGIVLAEDPLNEVCMIFLGLEQIEVEAGDEFEAGDFIGYYRFNIHFTVLEATCEDVNWYDWDARQYERPLAFIEMGDAIPNDLTKAQAIPFLSQNPSSLEDLPPYIGEGA